MTFQGLIDSVAFLDWWGSVGRSVWNQPPEKPTPTNLPTNSVWNQPPQKPLPHDTASSSPPYGTSTYPTPGTVVVGGGVGGGSTPGYHDRIALEARLVPTNLSTTPTNLHTNLVEAGSKAIVSPHVSPAPTATVATEPYSSTNLATEPYTPSSPSEAVVRAVNVSQRGAPASHQIMQIGGNTHTHTHTHTKHKHMYIIYIYIYKYIYTYIYIHGFALENADRG